jgi:hypothetical protein
MSAPVTTMTATTSTPKVGFIAPPNSPIIQAKKDTDKKLVEAVKGMSLGK